MPTLSTRLTALEAELCDIVTDAWGVSKIATSPREQETTLSALPEAYVIIMGAEASEEEGSLCAESARVPVVILLHAKKPAAGALLASEKRTKAQALRTAVKAHTFTNSSNVRWESEQYDAREDAEVEATSGDYMIRLVFSAFVEWTD